jgi:hypothetical protein
MRARIASVAVACLAALPLSAADRTNQAAKLRALIEGKRFAPIATVESLPAPVRAELARLMEQDALSMADPGQKFEATDDISDRTLSGRRMILAGRSDDLVLVHYERGGYAHLYLLLVFRTSEDGARLAFAGQVKGPIAEMGGVGAAQVADSAPNPFPY